MLHVRRLGIPLLLSLVTLFATDRFRLPAEDVAVAQAPAAPQPSTAPAPPLADTSLAIRRVEEYMQAHVRVSKFSGTILLARAGTPVVTTGYGFANAEWKIRNSAETKFRIGSITKQFTSMTIMRLQEQGKLKVQDPICRHLAPCPDAWKPVTLHHLLTHTSGIPSYTSSPEYGKTMMVPKTVEEMVAGFRNQPLEFEPGAQFKYSNSGYFLLGVIIEKLTGKPYDDVLRAEIFDPLGMKDTGYDRFATVLPQRATGYSSRSGELMNAPFLDMVQPFSAGALYSTVLDLLKWDQALYTDRLLPAAAKAAMWTPFRNDYAYGWGVVPASAETFGHARIFHSGGINGFSSMIIRLPDDNMTAIVLANNDAVNASAIARDLVAILFGQPYQIPAPKTSAH